MAAQLKERNHWQSADDAQFNSIGISTDVWLIDLQAPTLIQPNVLSEQEIQRAQRFVSPKRRIGYMVAHTALRHLLSAYSGLSAKELRFIEGAYGKPILSDSQVLHFNLSHSEQYALVAVSSCGPVGVDVEDKMRDLPWEIAPQVFSKREIALMQKLPKQQLVDVFYEGWCRKEALVKADGRGLNLDLTQLEVIDEDICELNMTWSLRRLPEIAGHASALVTPKCATEIRTYRYVNSKFSNSK
ncbi:4'-phosphopantetheinyl transferase family protein [Curvivirga sp.]|uniref:4'-phosphopantetheinyl transferase family protein n=1 Tax=Curvivirga sp. TaxID=2856848 RepID=UPI003B5AE199